jgi:outer membrane protein
VDGTSYSSSFSLRQRLFDVGSTLGSIRSARASADASEENARATRLDVILGVEETYYGLLKTHRLVEVAQQARDQLELHYRQAQAFFSVGTHPRYDVTKAEADLTSAELDLIKARNNERLAAVALAAALGLDTGRVPPIRDIQDSRADSVGARESLAEAETGRPDLRAAQARLRSAGASLSAARGELFPTVDASVSYGWRGPDFPLERAWSAGLSASMPIFDGLLTVRRIQEASASKRAVEADYASLLLQARQDVESSVLNLNVARDNLRVTQKLLAEAQENFNVAEGRYKAGSGSVIDLADAQVLLTNARTQDVQSRYDLQIARSTWLRALGRDR